MSMLKRFVDSALRLFITTITTLLLLLLPIWAQATELQYYDLGNYPKIGITVTEPTQVVVKITHSTLYLGVGGWQFEPTQLPPGGYWIIQGEIGKDWLAYSDTRLFVGDKLKIQWYEFANRLFLTTYE